jgi:HAD superfamily hydrolase (TIGR01509 family)
MSELKALIFDVDGTLAETERDGHRVAFNRAFAEAGLDWNWPISLYGELLDVAGGKERIRYFLDRDRPDFTPPPRFDEFVANLHKAKTRFYQELLATGSIPLRPGVRELLENARQEGLRLAIATTSALPNAIGLLEYAIAPHAVSWFEVIAAGDIVPRKKPAPDIYLYVLEQMGLQPQECIAIEDSQQGLIAATQAGLKTVVTVNDYTRHQDFSDAALVMESLTDLEQPLMVLKNLLTSPPDPPGT